MRFSPFFAAGMLTVYFGGGASGAIFFAAATAALICFAANRKKSEFCAKAVLCAVGTVCGVLLMSGYMRLYCDPISKYAGQTIEAQIFVREVTGRSGQFEEILAKVKLDGRTAKLRLTCDEVLLEDHVAEVTIELEAAERTADNLSSGIFLSGEITEIRSAVYNGASISSCFRVIRENFYGRLAENVFGDSGALAAAMLFGESVGLSPKYTEYLKVSGAAHYTAVSGAHFAVFAAALLAVVPQNRRKTRFIVSTMFAPAGLLFYGASPSVLRASVMFFVYSLGMLLHRKPNPLNSLCLAAAVIPIFSPFTIVDAGFAMSVLGVFGVGVIGPELAKKLCEFIPDKAKHALSPIVTALACSVCAVVCTSPISAALFKGVAPIGAVTSLLLAPLMAVAMMFMLLLGATNIRLFAVPIDLSMKLAAAIAKAFGKCRVLTLPLDYNGAWILLALLAIILTICAFGDLKTFSRFGKAAVVLMLIVPAISAAVITNRHEVRFIGNSYSAAAVVFDRNTAAVYISGGGDGLSASISRVLRERGAVRITTLVAPEADYGGALAIKELSEMLPIREIRSNALVKGLLPDLDVQPPPEDGVFAVSGITIGSADSVSAPNADILLYSGRMDNVTESSAKTAVYFTKKEYDLPENFHNARVDRDFCVKLTE
ncbi:MAG: ComEC/Rec2 family competence protein [Oscillospiraceae bacterium]|nr:ComEC/Rec2 family competence protein [Oscillospiraceae bacterium]